MPPKQKSKVWKLAKYLFVKLRILCIFYEIIFYDASGHGALDYQILRKTCYTGNSQKASLLYVCACVLSVQITQRKPCHIGYKQTAFWHWEQTNGFYPVCNSMCLLRICLDNSNDWKKAFSHWVQANCLLSVCKMRCLSKPINWENALSQPVWEQINGFSPVWQRMCLLRSPDWGKFLLQSVHIHVFSPVWESLCLFSLFEL